MRFLAWQALFSGIFDLRLRFCGTRVGQLTALGYAMMTYSAASTVADPAATRVDFQAAPDRYRHWKLNVQGDVAVPTSMEVQ